MRLLHQRNPNAGKVYPASILSDRLDKLLKNSVHTWGIFTEYSQHS
ncbi:hypothetical protein QUB80_20880 [Chlorogloeopsis sp. ULAP01]|nr:hypothetical protein [Chlorogloeopsis sp. ULAP01]MDM9383152.1 hypothetical protein [Chlorogloeopsis sp. ULAP01]